MSRLLILLVALGFTSCSSNSSKDKALSSDLLQLENQFTQAMKDRDRPTLERIVTPEFTVTGLKYIDSAAVTRSVWMTNTLEDQKIDSARFLNVKANTIENVGIVRANFFWKGSYGGQAFSDTIAFVDTWVKTSGDWRIVSRVIADK